MHRPLASALSLPPAPTPRRTVARLRHPRPFRISRRAADGRVTAVKARASAGAAQVDLATSLSYKPFGPLSGLTYGNGLSLARSHDQNYWLTGQTLTGTAGTLLGMSIARDANGNVSAVTDTAAANRNAAYTYTDAGRLATASGLWGSDAYTWDANGNRTRADRTQGAASASDVATIPAASNRQSEVRDGAGVLAKSFAYSASGDVVSKTEGATTTGFTYDARGRMVAVTQGAATLASYAYDHSGQRVASMDQSGVQAHYLFDEDGRLMAEYDALTGNLLLEYVWLEGQAIALASGPVSAPVWRYVTTGHLDEPLLVTDAAQGVVSSTTRDAWGNTIVLAGSDVLTLSYPGQWKALTAGLYHNWHRDYDPSLGRYVQADPIGLAGGSNVYAYAWSNPVNLTDPMGLGPIGAAIGGGFGRWGGRAIGGAAGGVVGGPVGAVGGGIVGGLGGQRAGSALGSAIEDACRRALENGSADDEDGPCEDQKRDDELECNQWHIYSGRDGYSRQQGYQVCMKTVMTRYGECRSRGMNPARITTPLFLPTGRRGIPDRTRPRR